MKNPSEENRFRTWLKSNYGIQDYEDYRNTQTEELAIQYAAQSVREDRGSRWISVKDRLPEPKEQVLVYQPPKKWNHKDEMTKGRVLIGYMFRLPQDERGTWIDLNELNDKACSLRQGGLFWAFPYICHQNFVTHWQPLPSPPINH